MDRASNNLLNGCSGRPSKPELGVGKSYKAAGPRVRPEKPQGPYHFSYRLGRVNPFSDPEVAAAVIGA